MGGPRRMGGPYVRRLGVSSRQRLQVRVTGINLRLGRAVPVIHALPWLVCVRPRALASYAARNRALHD